LDEGSLELPDDMPIVEAYFRHVERYIYSHPKARKMLSLDGDPVRGEECRNICPCGACGISPFPHIITVGLLARRSCLPHCS